MCLTNGISENGPPGYRAIAVASATRPCSEDGSEPGPSEEVHQENKWEECATTEPPLMGGGPGGTRTPDILLRRQMLYPAELRARSEFSTAGPRFNAVELLLQSGLASLLQRG
jgi:hypothetical protein